MKEEFSFSDIVIQVMMTATSISRELEEGEVSALDFILAVLAYSDNGLYDYLSEEKCDGEYTTSIIEAMELDEELYERFTHKNYNDFLNTRKSRSKTYDYIVKAKNENSDMIDNELIDSDIFLECNEEMDEVLDLAVEICERKNKHIINIDTLIYASLNVKNSTAMDVLNYYFNGKEINFYFRKLLKLNAKNKKGVKQEIYIPDEISEYVTDLTMEWANQPECDILNRDDEILSVWNVLSKKTKRNVILIGEPGVGKTAIVDAITYSIANNRCPKQFSNYRVLSLNLNNMVSNTSLRGEFESKARDFIEFVESQENVIVFIDEIHRLIGTGDSVSSAGDLSQTLKPVLSRDKIMVIGATTTDEYDIMFLRDGALKRRFETIMVKEPQYNEVKPMIRKRVENLCKFHNVECSEKMLDKAILYAKAFKSVCNPDASVDFLDKCLAMAKMDRDKKFQDKHIQEVFRRNYEIFTKTPEKLKYRTACHEAGHFVAWLLNKRRSSINCTMITIIPSEEFAGATFYELEDISRHPNDYHKLEDEIAFDLGGRIAQKFSGIEAPDAGATADLQEATRKVEKYLMEWGIDSEYQNVSLVTANDKLHISDATSDEIRRRAKVIINDVFKQTEARLKLNKEGILRVADLLMEKHIISAKEAENAFYSNKEVKKEHKVLA